MFSIKQIVMIVVKEEEGRNTRVINTIVLTPS